jgi:hypothetical protein
VSRWDPEILAARSGEAATIVPTVMATVLTERFVAIARCNPANLPGHLIHTQIHQKSRPSVFAAPRLRNRCGNLRKLRKPPLCLTILRSGVLL